MLANYGQWGRRMNNSLQFVPDLQQLARDIWGEGKRSGRAVLYRARWRSGDDTPSFAVYMDGYKDFGGSGESGSPIQWVMQELGYNYRDAKAWLENWNAGYNVGSPSISIHELPSAKSNRHEPPPQEWQRHLRDAVRETQHLLWSSIGVGALDYLRKERALSDETIRAAGLGYAPSYVKTGYFYKTAEGKKNQVSISPGIVIPWEVDSVLYAVRIRSRVGGLAKALNIPDERLTYGNREGEVVDKYLSATGSRLSGVLYGAQAIESTQKVIFVEGEFDTLLAGQQLAGEAICVTFGSASSVPSALPERYATRLANHEWIYSVMDADAAGSTAGDKLHKLFGTRHKRLTLPEGHKDITEYASAGGGVRGWFVSATVEQVAESWITATLHLSDRDGKHHGTGGPVYYALIRCGNAKLLDTQAFQIKELQEAAHQLNQTMRYDLVRDGVGVLEDNGLLVKIGSESDGICDPNSTNNLNGKPTSGRKGGRPADVYRLASPDERLKALMEALTIINRQKAFPIKKTLYQDPTVADLERRTFSDVNLDEENHPPVETTSIPAKTAQRYARKTAFRKEKKLGHLLIDRLIDLTTTPFPADWNFDTLRNFRTTYLRALQLAVRVGSSLEAVSEAIGISRDSVNQYVEWAACDIEGNQSVVVALHPDEPIEQQVRQTAMNVKGKPIALEIVQSTQSMTIHLDEPSSEVLRVPYTAAAAYRAIEQGEQVQIRYQTANKHIPRLDAKPLTSVTCKQYKNRVRLSDDSMRGELAAMGKKRGKKRLQMQKSPSGLRRQQYSGPINPDYDDEVVDDDDYDNYEEEHREPQKAGYTREWVEGQIRLRLELLEWLSEDETQYVNPNTGEVIPYESSLEELVELMVNRPANAERRNHPKWRALYGDDVQKEDAPQPEVPNEE